MMKILKSWKQKARNLKKDTYLLYLAYKDPRVPWYAKFFILAIVGYTFSPIDLIPDFIPVLGYLDDLILIPLAIGLAVKMVPVEVMEEYKKRAESDLKDVKTNWIAGIPVILVWLFLIYIWLPSF